MQEKIELLADLVRLLEWGDDGFCPLCDEVDRTWDGSVLIPGKHKPDCPVKLALG